MTDSPPVIRNDEAGQYQLVLDDGLVAGFTEFVHDGPGRLIFPHTEIDPAFSGRGYATTLVSAAMADVAARGETVVPVCPFVVKYLKEHEVPGLKIEWKDRYVTIADEASTAEKTPSDEGVGS